MFCALTVKLNVPAALGVPLITPVAELSTNPPGKTPLSILHVIGCVPVALRVWLYAVPTVPPAKVVVDIDGSSGQGTIEPVRMLKLSVSVGVNVHPNAVPCVTSVVTVSGGVHSSVPGTVPPAPGPPKNPAIGKSKPTSSSV